ncbi:MULTISPECIES: diguanylate cyclase domain-containing protein [unclassified Priestia]|uniref:sensor domain-containing diguanylate cyclase n=1 Tax=unclassified Priestia TaxID=2800374 RepID=UPI00366E20DC
MSQLLFNITLIVSFMFAASIVREQIIYRVEGIKRYKMYRLIYYGFSYGLLGSILMVYTIKIDSTIILDLRFLAVTIVCLYAGIVPAIIAACIIGVMRLLLFGITASGIIGAAAIIVMALLSGWAVRLPYRPFIRFQLMNSISLLCVFFSLSFLFKDIKHAATIIVYLLPASFIGGCLVYLVGRYIYVSRVTTSQHKKLSKMFSVMVQNAKTGTMIETPEREVAVINQTFCDMFDIPGPPHQYVGLKSNQLFLSHAPMLKDPARFLKTVESTVYSKESIVDEEITFINGKIYARDYIPIYEGHVYIGHYWEYRDITEKKKAECDLRKANKKLEMLSMKDGLTGLNNRRSLDKKLEIEWEYAQKENEPLSFLLFDIDYFKAYNDTYGHIQGDECLKEVANIAKSVVFDESAFVARYGGEEFGILLPRANQYEAIKMAEAIRQQVEHRGIIHQASDVFKCITISVGIMTVVPSENIPPISIVHGADQALYEAKRTGRNRISVYSHHKEADSNV